MWLKIYKTWILKITKPCLVELLEILISKEIYHAHGDKFHYFKMSVFPKVIYRFNAINPHQNPNRLFCRNWQKSHMEKELPSTSKIFSLPQPWKSGLKGQNLLENSFLFVCFLMSLLNLLKYCFYSMFLVFWPRSMWDLSFLTRDWTHTSCIGRWSLNHWTTRGVPLREVWKGHNRKF